MVVSSNKTELLINTGGVRWTWESLADYVKERIRIRFHLLDIRKKNFVGLLVQMYGPGFLMRENNGSFGLS